MDWGSWISDAASKVASRNAANIAGDDTAERRPRSHIPIADPRGEAEDGPLLNVSQSPRIGRMAE